jgi:hypothetical protein
MSGDHDYAAAASLLGLSAAWLRKHIRELPHLKYGHIVKFTDTHLAEIRAMHERRPADQQAPASALRPSTRRRSS